MSFKTGRVYYDGNNPNSAIIFPPSAIIGNYNTPERLVLTTGQNITINALTVHSLAFKVVSGNGTISINNTAAQAIDAGESDSWTASELIAYEFDFVCTVGKIVITTMKRP